MLSLMITLAACASTPTPEPDRLPGGSDTAGQPAGEGWVLAGGTVVGLGLADVEIRDGRIAAVGAVDPALPTVDVSGHWLAPAFIDSHVHLVYLPQPVEMAQGGIAAVVDLAAPLSVFDADWAPLQSVRSGPMVTAQGGYPTTGWGANGYGWECADADQAVVAVEELHGFGAGVIKLPVTGGSQLDDDALAAAAARAHALGLPVASHALGDSEVQRAAAAGVDVLAHTPTGALGSDALAAWSDRAVISTLRAFGSGSTAVSNLQALHEAGATVLYGTDFGNSRTAGIDGAELAVLQEAGLDGAAILAAGTSAPAAFWGLDSLGSVDVGKAASLLVLSADPLVDPLILATPAAVYLDGLRRD